MRPIPQILAGCLLLALSGSVFVPASVAQPAHAPMPVYVTPYYDSEGPEIHIGAFSDRLMSDDLGELRSAAEAMQADWEALSVESMYVAAIRFYDLGSRRDAVYWFYAAQYRARLFTALVSQKSAKKFRVFRRICG